MEPRVQYTHTADGVAIAYAVSGEGPPLLFARPLLSAGIDDEIARSNEFWPALTESHSVVLWDVRGGGLSGSAPEAGFDDWLADMEAVADGACADRFDLVGEGPPCHLAVAYAARQPDRVNRLVLYAPSPPGFSLRRVHPAWLFALGSENWHDFVDILALRLFGWNRADVAQRWADRIRAHFTPEQFLHFMDVAESIDATGDAGSISTPTLVIDDRGGLPAGWGREVPQQQFAHFARQLAAGIPGAHLAVIKPGDPPAAQVVELFLSGNGGAAETRPEASIPSGTAVIVFADIVDSTALTERLGDDAFREKARGLDAAMRVAIRESGGTAVEGKTLGDGVLAVFTSAKQAIACAQACHEGAFAAGLALHAGIHAGDVIREADNVYGGAVNIAARVAAASAAGETLVSATVRELARTSAGVAFEDRGEQSLKGIDDPVRVWAVRQA